MAPGFARIAHRVLRGSRIARLQQTADYGHMFRRPIACWQCSSGWVWEPKKQW
jgi:hypothetical protein